MTQKHDSLESLPNLGSKSAAMLRQAGIHSREQIAAMGPALAFIRVQRAGLKPSRNLLWAIAAMLQGKHWTELSEQEKKALIESVDKS